MKSMECSWTSQATSSISCLLILGKRVFHNQQPPILGCSRTSIHALHSIRILGAVENFRWSNLRVTWDKTWDSATREDKNTLLLSSCLGLHLQCIPGIYERQFVCIPHGYADEQPLTAAEDNNKDKMPYGKKCGRWP